MQNLELRNQEKMGEKIYLPQRAQRPQRRFRRCCAPYGKVFCRHTRNKFLCPSPKDFSLQADACPKPQLR